MLLSMAKPARRDFWDWVHILNDGAKIVLGSAAVILMMIVDLPGVITSSIIGHDDETRRSKRQTPP